jgi:hypothetical protein
MLKPVVDCPLGEVVTGAHDLSALNSVSVGNSHRIAPTMVYLERGVQYL